MKKYRLKGWYLLLSGLMAIIALSAALSMVASIISVIPVGAGILLVGFSFEGWQAMELLVPLGIMGGFLALLAGLAVLMGVMGVITTLGNTLFSYLGIGPMGLELRDWPSRRLRCDWDQVVGVEQVSVIGRYSLSELRLKEGAIKSWMGLLRSRRRRNLIPLYLFKGWPDGELRQDLEDKIGPISLDQ